jgi:hypothetical protein
MRIALLGVAAALWLAPSVHAAAAKTRLLFTSNRSGPTEIYAADPSGRAAPGQLTFSNPQRCQAPDECGFDSVIPSPDGRHIAFTVRYTLRGYDGEELWVARWNGLDARAVVSPAAGLSVRSVAWSSGTRLRYIVRSGDLYTLREVRADGTHDRLVSAVGRDTTLTNGDSPNHQWSVTTHYIPNTLTGLEIQRKDLRKVWVIEGAQDFAWAPNGRLLAYTEDPGGVGVFDVRTGRQRVLTTDAALSPSWSSDGETIGYLHIPSLGDGTVFRQPLDFAGVGHELKTVTLKGRTRVVVGDDGPFGGARFFAWTRPPSSSYRRLEGVEGVYTRTIVKNLSADGARVAFATCADLGVASGTSYTRVAPVGCVGGPWDVESLALTGANVAYSAIRGGNTTNWMIARTDAGAAANPSVLASGDNTCCLPQPLVAGSGELLVYATRTIAYPDVHWLIQRAGSGCPCLPLTGFTKPLADDLALDVDANRILASGRDWVEIFAAGGQALLLVDRLPPTVGKPPFRAPATEAALTGDELLVRVGDELRIYSAMSGAQQRTLPLVRASSPFEASYPVLQDAARGRAVYVRDRHVHVVDLATGTDRMVGSGDLARFYDDGLAYANGARIRLVSWTALP